MEQSLKHRLLFKHKNIQLQQSVLDFFLLASNFINTVMLYPILEKVIAFSCIQQPTGLALKTVKCYQFHTELQTCTELLRQLGYAKNKT